MAQFSLLEEALSAAGVIRKFGVSKEEAIDWVKRYPYPLAGEGEVEIRQVFEA